MSKLAPTAADIEDLLDREARLRPLEYRTPPELLRAFGSEIDKIVLPCLMSLHRRCVAVDAALVEFTKQFVKTDKRDVDAVVRDAKRTEATAKQICHEIEVIQLEFDSSLELSKRKTLQRALELRAAELSLLERRLEGNLGRIDESLEKAERIIPSVAEVQNRVEGLPGRFSKALFRLSISSIGAEFILRLPVVIAFITTVVLDRAKRFLEPFTKRLAPIEYHDLLLLGFFALQVLALTPAVSKFSTRVCWHNLDATMRAVRSLLPDVRDVEARVTEAEERFMSLPSVKR